MTRPRRARRASVLPHTAWACYVAASGALSGACDNRQAFHRPDPSLARMLDQRRADPYAPSSAFADGKTMRDPPRGAVARDDDELDFRFLGVSAAARGRGVGEVLVRHVMELAARRGIRRVVLNTGPEMQSAQRLYSRLGFARLHERECVVDLPSGRSFLLMAYGRDVEAVSQPSGA